LFAGAGGCSLGFKRAGYRILYAQDIEPSAVETYRANFPETPCCQEDIQTFDFEKLRVELGLETGALDILIGGPPCQGFSTAGARFWDDPRNALLKNYVHALDVFRPKWFLMENVEGLLTLKKGQYVSEIAKAFVNLGYLVRIDKVYAHEYGVPQRRKRVFLIGNALGFDFDLPTPFIDLKGPIFRQSDVTLRDVIGSLPPAAHEKDTVVEYDKEPTSELDRALRSEHGYVSDHYCARLNELDLERICALSPGQTMKDLPERLQHASFKRRAHRRVMDGTPTERRGGPPSGLKRLHFYEPSLTITSASTREFIHPEKNRPLTIRECARIQTFPDGFEFKGSASQRIKQVGNAIPPSLAYRFATHIKDGYGFPAYSSNDRGRVLGFTLTKASAMSPALARTQRLLSNLPGQNAQLSMFSDQ